MAVEIVMPRLSDTMEEGRIIKWLKQVGDTVTLVGTGYLVTLVNAPGATRMQAVQERGVEVVILDVADHEGESWYMIDAPTGEGWVKAENISTEAP